jgi:hypothetical protein
MKRNQFMTQLIASAPKRTGTKIFATLAATAALALVSASDVLAQGVPPAQPQQPRPAQPRPPAAQQRPPAAQPQQPAPQQQQNPQSAIESIHTITSKV